MYTTKTVDSQTTSPWIPLDDNQAAFNVSVAVAVTGTMTYTVQFTLDNIQDPSVTPLAFDVPSLASKTASASTSLRSSVKAVRLNVTSYTSGSATIGVRQGTSWDGVDLATVSGPVTLHQSGISFWLPPGDGGANGLNFTGTRGVFTLSAASPMQYAVGYLRNCYCYLPTGAGGLSTGGWYWCQMSDDTNGEIFAETYISGNPSFVSSPTVLSNLVAGRITQTLNPVTGPNFTLPGGALGPNGLLRASAGCRANNSANAKTLRVLLGTQAFLLQWITTSGNIIDTTSLTQNQGIETLQSAVPQGLGREHYAGPATLTSLDATGTVINTAVDQTVSMVLDLAATSDSIIGILRQVTVQYGA